LSILFSIEFKELISRSREMAIDLGYEYISTIHFFLADCESKSKSSLLRFGFKSDDEYLNFKKNYTLNKADLLDFINDSLPLTKEAEMTIKLMENVRMLNKQTEYYPSHFFIAALKNKKSLLFKCFQKNESALEKLIKYYQDHGEFERNKLTDKEISKLYYVSPGKTKSEFLKKIGSFFKW
jgi:ATP-dependent Clp protease ATP-binding subunit ClpA